ncbi:MAG: AAA family ATPase [Bacteroidetes bacterium]|nr:AAA family ATPase [Bacteroidota bacterium]
MLERKIQSFIKEHLRSNTNKVLVIDGARQIGKSYIIRFVCGELFRNYIEINLLEDFLGERLFEHTTSVEDFYLQISMLAGNKMGVKEDTVIFLDEIQTYPHLLTLLKFLQHDSRFTYIASGSLLGVTLAQTVSIPIGSIEVKRMYPLDFEEFLWANNFGKEAIKNLRRKFLARESLPENIHNKVMDLFKKYLLAGGLPDVVNTYLETKNVMRVRDLQTEIGHYYAIDASKYDAANRLKIRKIYEMIPSSLENKKKRIVVKTIENKAGKRYSDYEQEFEYLIHSGIALEVRAISNPVFPLIESSNKNLLKLYLNDVGMLTNVLYKNNIRAIMDNKTSINLGSVYECAIACELKAHGKILFYYDNKKRGEVNFLIDDYDTLSVVPVEVKSGKDYSVHRALNNFISVEDYDIQTAYVISNEREVTVKNKIVYIPVYYGMFL